MENYLFTRLDGISFSRPYSFIDRLRGPDARTNKLGRVESHAGDFTLVQMADMIVRQAVDAEPDPLKRRRKLDQASRIIHTIRRYVMHV